MQTSGIGPAKDARDIQAIGTALVERLTADFENTMAGIDLWGFRFGRVLLGPD
jgi:hypothetical protein